MFDLDFFKFILIIESFYTYLVKFLFCLIWKKTLLFYFIYIVCLYVPSFGTFPVFKVSCPIAAFYAQIPDFYANIPCYLGFYA